MGDIKKTKQNKKQEGGKKCFIRIWDFSPVDCL